MLKSKNYFSISEVSELLKIKQHVIRYWDSQFDGISTRLGNKKRRFFNQINIKKLETLKKLLHTDGKSHYSLAMAKKILSGNIIDKKLVSLNKPKNNKAYINKLMDVSENLKNLLK